MEVRREEILSTTVELLDRLGLAATRVADVAAALDVSPALVFYHFGTKDDLVAEAFAHAVERDLDRLEKAAPATTRWTRLRRVLRLYGPTGRATGLADLDRRLGAGPARAAPSARCSSGSTTSWQDILRGVVDDGVAAGVFTCADPAATVARLSALVDGLSVATVVHRSVTREQLRSWVAAQLAVELGVDVGDTCDSAAASRHTSQCAA